MNAVFETRGVTFAYPATGPVVADVTVAIPEGRLCAVLGPNGSGKSTLLKLLTGLLQPLQGTVYFRGKPVGEWPVRARAREIAVVPQTEETRFPMTVRHSVAMGRYPHLGPWRPERPVDRDAIEAAMARASVAHLRDRTVQQLSGGERQRVRIARALAQESSVLVLDEPTSSLDVHYEMEILELLSGLRDDGVTLVMVTHSLNLAARYADRLLLMSEGNVIREGDARDVLDRDTLESVYAWPFAIVDHSLPGPDRGAPQVVALRPDADGPESISGAQGPGWHEAHPDP